MNRNGTLKPYLGQDAMVVALARGKTVTEACGQTGISRTTVYRWLGDPGFCHRVEATRKELFDRAIGRLADSASAAADTLAGLLQDGSPTIRLGAARANLELAIRWKKLDAVDGKLVSAERVKDVIGRVFEAVIEHVPDQETRNRIAVRLEEVVVGTTSGQMCACEPEEGD